MGKKAKLAALLLAGIILITGCKGGDDNKYAYRETGIEKLAAGDFEGAVQSLDLAIEKSSGRVGKFEMDVLKYRGEAEYRLEDFKAAADTYDVLMQVDGEKPEYMYLRGICRAAQGQWEGALEDYTKANVKDKEAAGAKEALEAVGAALETADQLDKAMVMYQQAIADGMQSGQVYNRMGLCKLKDKEYDEAIGYFELGLKTGDEKVAPELAFNRAVGYEYKGEFALALTYMQEYETTYGPDENAKREIEFLKTR